MLLTDLRDYVESQGVASLFDLSKHFNTDPLVLQPMLALWVRRGVLRLSTKTNNCGKSCTKCSDLFTECYQFVVFDERNTEVSC